MADGFGSERMVVKVPRRPVVVEPGHHELACRCARVMDFQGSMLARLRSYCADQMLRHGVPADVVGVGVERIMLSLSAAVEVHSAELQEAFIADLMSRYTAEELSAMLAFYETDVGRSIYRKSVSGRSMADTVFEKILLMAEGLLGRSSSRLED